MLLVLFGVVVAVVVGIVVVVVGVVVVIVSVVVGIVGVVVVLGVVDVIVLGMFMCELFVYSLVCCCYCY